MGPHGGLNPTISQLDGELLAMARVARKLSISRKKVRRILLSAGVSEQRHV
jgi:hypothetical protein